MEFSVIRMLVYAFCHALLRLISCVGMIVLPRKQRKAK